MLLPDVQNQYHLEEINSARHELALYITENVKIAIFVYIYIYKTESYAEWNRVRDKRHYHEVFQCFHLNQKVFLLGHRFGTCV